MQIPRRTGLSGLLLAACLFASFAVHAEPQLLVEEMTWPEVAEAIQGGKRTALIFAGSTEQNGPHMALGKHNLVARHLALAIARELGDALVYPVLPFAPTGSLSPPQGHMRFPGSVSLRKEVYGEVLRDVALSAVQAGFRFVIIMGDHGEGQDQLAAIAQALDAELRWQGVRVLHADAVYTQSTGEHAGREDTSMLLAVSGGERRVRKERYRQADAQSGAAGDPVGASAAEGKRLLALRIEAAVCQIREFRERPSR